MREINAKLSEKVSKSLIGKFGKDSRRWKGDNASYVAKHMWIVKHYGKASKCELCGTNEPKRYEWANISGEYRRERTDYMELCPSCHRKMDLYRTHCKNGHELTEKNMYINKRGWKVCRLCRNEACRRYKERCKEK